jgi:hypothetical protein
MTSPPTKERLHWQAAEKRVIAAVAGLAGVAGVGYAVAYGATRFMKAPILTHFVLNVAARATSPAAMP